MTSLRAFLVPSLCLLFIALLPVAGRAGTETYQVAASDDDTTANGPANNCPTCSDFYVPYTTGDRRAFMRWEISIPKGAAITSAYLYLKFNGEGNSGPSTARIQAIDQDDCPNFSANPYDWAVSAAYADWTIASWTAGEWTQSDNIGPVIQAFIDRPGYEYGNGLGLRALNAAGSWKRAETYDAGDHSSAPMLEVNYTGGEVPIELWMADPHIRLGQKVYVQLSNVAPTDRMVVTLDGTTIHEKIGDLFPEEVVTTDYRGLGLGPHTLRVEVRAADSTLRGSAEETWTQIRDGIPHVGIDENNAICVNGEPFFPVTPWGVEGAGVATWLPYINTLNHQGWNTAKDIAGWTGALDNAQNYGVKILGPLRGNYWPNGDTSNIVEDPPGSGNWVHYTEVDIDQLASYVSATKDHPGLFMWGWKDEPDLGGGDQYIPATEVKRWTDKCHELDGNHPNAVNIVGYGFTGSPPYPNYGNNRAASYCFLYSDQKTSAMGDNEPFAKKTVCCDVISMDYYPYEYATRYSYVSLEDCLLAHDRMREWNYNLIPTMTWIETCDIRAEPEYPWTPPPTPTELRNLCWLTVIHGVKGIQWFHYFEPTPAENYAVMNEFRDQITALTPVVLGPEETGADVTDVELGGGRVDIMVREHDAQVYIFAGEVRAESQTVRFDVDGLGAGMTVEVYDEARTITADAGSFTDTFDPLAIHIYVIDGLASGGVSLWQAVGMYGASEVALTMPQGYVHASAGGLARLRVHFNKPFDSATLSAASFQIVGLTGGDQAALIQSVAAGAGNLSADIVLSAPLPNADRYTITVQSTLRDTSGQPYDGETSRAFGCLAGDVNGSGTVSAADIMAVRAAVGSAVDATTARADVDSSGALNGTDMLGVRNRAGNSLP